MVRLSRLIGVALIALTASAHAQTPSHGLSLYGDLKYPAGFKHFEYVNPDAPKGGDLHLSALGTFDNFNPFIMKGNIVDGAAILFETLLTSSADEPFTEYGGLAEKVTVAPDRTWVRFDINEKAVFHDGKPVTADDAVFSLNILKEKGHPFYRSYYHDVVKAEKLGERAVKFTFKDGKNRELPLILGQLPVLAKHYWEKRDFAATTLEPPVGSGPYKIESFEQGRSITYKRAADWWAKDLPVNKGRYNFDTMTYDFYRDGTVALEALFAGRYDLRMENVAKNWAIGYDAPSVKQGMLVKLELPNATPNGMQAFVMNLRRPQFADARVREALSYAFDFEWSNKTVAFGAYKRSASYFSGSELAATGLPAAEELAILEPYRGKIPDEVFTTEFKPPKTDGSGSNRANIKKASELLAATGWKLQAGKLVKDGKQFTFEIVDESGALERWVMPYLLNLERLGIKANFRVVDAAQYQRMMDEFDYDMTIAVFPQSLSPGNEQRDFWNAAKADIKGSRNIAGIKNPVVDQIVEQLINADSRATLVTMCRVLDRVLLWNHYMIPQWHYDKYRIAYWDKFGKPALQPKYGVGAIDTWWVDPAKAEKINKAQKRNK